MPAFYLYEHWKGIHYTSSEFCPLTRYSASLTSPALYEVLNGGSNHTLLFACGDGIYMGSLFVLLGDC